ncbi:hypothetical protein K8I28_10685 [bacterium]|nr:hypothetical protein [bacterium]
MILRLDEADINQVLTQTAELKGKMKLINIGDDSVLLQITSIPLKPKLKLYDFQSKENKILFRASPSKLIEILLRFIFAIKPELRNRVEVRDGVIHAKIPAEVNNKFTIQKLTAREGVFEVVARVNRLV